MTREQARERIWEVIRRHEVPYAWPPDTLAAEILDILPELGYRLVPELQVLGDEKIKKLRPDVPMCQQTGFDCEGCSGGCRQVAQAQRDYDQRQIQL